MQGTTVTKLRLAEWRIVGETPASLRQGVLLLDLAATKRSEPGLGCA